MGNTLGEVCSKGHLRMIKTDRWILWMQGGATPVRKSNWLIVGAHGSSPHETEVDVPGMNSTIYFLTPKGEAAPGLPNSVYVSRIQGGEAKEVVDMAQGQKPFEYGLSWYEDSYLTTVTDMVEGSSIEKKIAPNVTTKVSTSPGQQFDCITIRKHAGTVNFSDILKWLQATPNLRYPHIIGGFCQSSSYSRIGVTY